jgi:electron transfer flavoprotein beta subunit
MRALVAVKRVVDYAVKVRVRADKTGVELENVKMSMNPFCEIAVEEGLRLKEKGHISELIAVSAGPDKAAETLRQALAMGADRAIHLKTPMRTDQELQPLAVAKLLKQVVEKEQPAVVLLGKQAIDDDSNQTGAMLAGMLGWPQAGSASKVEVNDGKTHLQVDKEVDSGIQQVKIPLPAVVTADLRLNEPRYATLPNLMKAKKKPMETIDAASTGVDLSPRLQILKVEEPPVRAGGKKVDSVDELLDKLKTEAKVL